MKRLVISREAYTLYDRWFTQPIPPKNAPLNIPMSYLLQGPLEVPDRLGSGLIIQVPGLPCGARRQPAMLASCRLVLRREASTGRLESAPRSGRGESRADLIALRTAREQA